MTELTRFNYGRSDRASWPECWFEVDTTPRVVVARNLQILARNAQARRLMSRARCLVDINGQLTSRDRRASMALQSLVAAAGLVAHATVIRPLAGDVVLVRGQALDADDRGPVALTLRDLGEKLVVNCPDLEAMYGLTRAEHQVMKLLLKGHSSQNIAEALEKSVLTIRTHIKRIYTKLGVQNREQLFARLVSYIFIE